jgi:hypothetical protein
MNEPTDSLGVPDVCLLDDKSCALLPAEVRQPLQETRTVHLASGVDGLRERIRQARDPHAARIVVAMRTTSPSEVPNPPCVIDQYSFHVVLEGQAPSVIRTSDAIVDVWRCKRFGKLIIRKPTEAELADPDFSPLKLISNEVLSHERLPQDPFWEEKLQAAVAFYVEAVVQSLPPGVPVELHSVSGGQCVSGAVRPEELHRRLETARLLGYQPKGIITESIGPNLGGASDEDGERQ